MNLVNDGDHSKQAVLNSQSVLVTPLSPPFKGPWVRFNLEGYRDLALSVEDAARIRKLMRSDPKGRSVILEAEGDNIRIMVSHNEAQ